MLGLVNIVNVPGLSVDFPGEDPERVCSRWHYQMMGFTLSSRVGSELSPTPPFQTQEQEPGSTGAESRPPVKGH